MDIGNITILVLLDMSAAFDCVSHSTLLNVLTSIGVSGEAHRWFHGYLSNRQQCSIVQGSRSTLLPVTSGVPQGSVLGPTLFALYLLGVGDIMKDHQVDYVIYADDVQLFVSGPPASLHLLILRLETCIAAVFSWLVTRHLSLNATKTDVLIFGSQRTLSNITFPGLSVDGTLITPSKWVRDLGVTIDSSLTMEFQVSRIRSQVFWRLRNIARIRRFLRPSQCAMVVKSLVVSHFHFCATLLSGIEVSLLTKLQSALNAAVRLLYRLKRSDSVDGTLIDIGLLPMKLHIQHRVLLQLHNILLSRQPQLLLNLLQTYAPRRSLRSETQCLLEVPRIQRRSTEKAFSVLAPRLWNSLPRELRELALSDFGDKCAEWLKLNQ
jgi:hypothetical protein